MNIYYGDGATKFGTGVQIDLTGDEVALAIDAYLVSHKVNVIGPRTICVNGSLIESGGVYIDPCGYVIHDGNRYDGRHNNGLNAEANHD
jgi:hypothetical protein